MLGGASTVLVVAFVVGCSTAVTDRSSARAASRATTAVDAPIIPTDAYRAGDVRVAIVGDSLTAGGARLLSAGLDKNTWMAYAQGRGIAFVGGFAEGGTTVQYQASQVRPVSDVDVLVLMSGTNDVRLGYRFDRVEKYYRQIVDTIKPKHVIIGAIPPYDRNPDGAATYERALKAYVQHDTDWTFVDPWGFARDGRVYLGGVSNDGIHPTTSGYRLLGANYRAAILKVADAGG